MNPEEAATFLRDLAQRLRRVPAMYDVDEGDVDQLNHIAGNIHDIQASQWKCTNCSWEGDEPVPSIFSEDPPYCPDCEANVELA